MSMVNLLPEDYIDRQRQKRTNLLCGILFGVVISGVLAGAAVSERAYRRTREVGDRVNQAYADAGKLIQQLKELERTRHQLLSKGEMTAGLLERVPRSYLLAVVTNSLPEGSSLIRFDLKTTVTRVPVGGVKPKTRFDQAGGTPPEPIETETHTDVMMVITGLAATDVEVGGFISAMRQCPLIERAELDYSQEKVVCKELVRQFRVTLHLETDADVPVGEGHALHAVAGMTRRPDTCADSGQSNCGLRIADCGFEKKQQQERRAPVRLCLLLLVFNSKSAIRNPQWECGLAEQRRYLGPTALFGSRPCAMA